MLTAPLFGWLADRMSRWTLVGVAVALWSAATGASGLATTYGALLITRLFVGIGEAGYGPAAPTIIADCYPARMRGSAMAWFYMAIPVGTALGYMLSSGVSFFTPNWRWAFYAVVPPGIVLGAVCLFMKDPPRGYGQERVDAQRKASLREYLSVFKIRSYLLDTAGMAAMTFAIGGISFYMPGYLADVGASSSAKRSTGIYGIVLLVAGVTATLSGGFIGDRLQRRWSGAYFIVSAGGIFLSVLFILLMLFSPFPLAWIWLFLGAFFLFFNTGPSNTILANVIHPSMRSTAFALNILFLHLFGDVLSQPLMGGLVDHYDSWRPAFYVVCAMMTIGGSLWLWGARFLGDDTRGAPYLLQQTTSETK
jgi:MFS family permease